MNDVANYVLTLVEYTFFYTDFAVLREPETDLFSL